MTRTLGYARVSSDGQDVATQKTKLEKLGALVVFTEVGNGSSLDGRDQLEAAIRLLEPGDILLALHPDRIARDTGDLLTTASGSSNGERSSRSMIRRSGSMAPTSWPRSC